MGCDLDVRGGDRLQCSTASREERRDETGMMSDGGEACGEVKAPLESAVVGALTLGCAVVGGRWHCSAVSLGTNNPHVKTESMVSRPLIYLHRPP